MVNTQKYGYLNSSMNEQSKIEAVERTLDGVKCPYCHSLIFSFNDIHAFCDTHLKFYSTYNYGNASRPDLYKAMVAELEKRGLQ